MIFGNKEHFAIESGVSKFLKSKNQMAIGFFNIYINSFQYGVRKEDASILGSSYYEVKNRIKDTGKHGFSKLLSAAEIIHIFQYESYGIGSRVDDLIAHQDGKLLQEIIDNKIVWAPDGDAAFDDGGHVFQIDEGKMVRIIGFINDIPAKNTSEIRIEAVKFYKILQDWSDFFYKDWDRNH
ncbi:hypothetical protein FHX10_002585 [Rhizobium sp. BK591]|uniref:Imm42 family immunity protein n=1 Tax=Rhizobium sp. BK591 TaxID=2586985 RepID=UPI00160AFBB2|nr:Imm42 family immunity protein [Rhizobium sp. BK591]MBB3743092.1 hypothetical protein [Rhizobium sp. BK591]